MLPKADGSCEDQEWLLRSPRQPFAAIPDKPSRQYLLRVLLRLTRRGEVYRTDEGNLRVMGVIRVEAFPPGIGMYDCVESCALTMAVKESSCDSTTPASATGLPCSSSCSNSRRDLASKRLKSPARGVEMISKPSKSGSLDETA